MSGRTYSSPLVGMRKNQSRSPPPPLPAQTQKQVSVKGTQSYPRAQRRTDNSGVQPLSGSYGTTSTTIKKNTIRKWVDILPFLFIVFVAGYGWYLFLFSTRRISWVSLISWCIVCWLCTILFSWAHRIQLHRSLLLKKRIYIAVVFVFFSFFLFLSTSVWIDHVFVIILYLAALLGYFVHAITRKRSRGTTNTISI